MTNPQRRIMLEELAAADRGPARPSTCYVSGGPAGYAVVRPDGTVSFVSNPSIATRMDASAAAALARRLVSAKTPQCSVKRDMVSQPVQTFYFTTNGIIETGSVTS